MTDDPLFLSVDECWLGSWRGPSVLVVDITGIRLITDPDVRPSSHLAGTVMPGFVDSHVHLGLVDASRVLAGGIAAVDDLGWDPAVAGSWVHQPGLPRIRFAGAFLTAPGGYPSDREWAPAGSVAEVASPAGVRAAVDGQLAAGASFIKVTLNSDAGPTFDDQTLRAVVEHSHVRGREVVAHVEGIGQAARAFEAGVDRLAHTPFSERLDDELLKAMAGPRARTLSGSQTWVSTLDIHGYGEPTPEFSVASDNLRRFHAYGGTVVYGTDLGNGPLRLGVNERELRALLAAGIGESGVIRALAAPRFGSSLSYLPGPRGGDLAAWLATASVITTGDLLDPEFPQNSSSN